MKSLEGLRKDVDKERRKAEKKFKRQEAKVGGSTTVGWGIMGFCVLRVGWRFGRGGCEVQGLRGKVLRARCVANTGEHRDRGDEDFARNRS